MSDISLEDIMKALKKLTDEERKMLEKELVIMRLSGEFNIIESKFRERRLKKKGENKDV